MSIQESTKSATFVGVKNDGTSETFTVAVKTSQGKVLPDPTPGQMILLSGVDAGFPEVVVRERSEWFQQMIRFAQKKGRIQSVVAMKKIKEELDAVDINTVSGDAWTEFCSKIADYYAFRFVAFKIPAPVVCEPEKI